MTLQICECYVFRCFGLDFAPNYRLKFVLVIRDIGYHGSETDVPIGTRIVIVAVAKAVAAMPEKPSPPTVDFGRLSATCVFLSINKTILVLNIFVSSVAASFLDNTENMT